MRVIVIVKATKDSEAGKMPSEKLITDMGNFNEELVKAGIMTAGEGVHPTSKGVRVHWRGGKISVEHGPFGNTEEQLAGFWLWKVKSMDEALEWAKRIPNPADEGDGTVEIRPVFEAEDFGEEFTPEARAQEERLRAELESRNK